MSNKPDTDPLAASDDPNVLTDDAGHAHTPLHEAMSAAVESAGDNEPQSVDTATEDMDGSDVDISSSDTDPGINTSTADGTTSVDAGINATDTHRSGNQPFDIQNNPNVDATDDSTRKSAPITVSNPFAAYASDANARVTADRINAAAQADITRQYGTPDNLHPAQFGVRLDTLAPEFGNSTDRKDAGPGAVVAGASAVANVQQEQSALRALNDRRAAHPVGADLSAETAAYQSAFRDLVQVRAPMPTLVRLDPQARTPQPVSE